MQTLRTAPILFTICILLSLLCLGCDQPFSAQSPFENRPVVYSVLSTDQQSQFVRLYTNYDMQGNDPLQNTSDHPVTGAQVVVTGPAGTYTFRDTVLARSDSSRYKDPIHAYVSSPFQVIPGSAYSLSISSQGFGGLSTVVKVPDRCTIVILPVSQFDDPSPGDPNNPNTIPVQAYVSSVSKGSLTQLFVDYDELTIAGWQAKRVEIPKSVFSVDTTVYTSTLPTLERIISYPMMTVFDVKAYQITLSRLKNAHPDSGLLFRRVVVRVLQVESNLYDYYSIVNGFRDRASIRIDEPDYSNIQGAYGVFGAYTVDSLVHPLPSNFTFNR